MNSRYSTTNRRMIVEMKKAILVGPSEKNISKSYKSPKIIRKRGIFLVQRNRSACSISNLENDLILERPRERKEFSSFRRLSLLPKLIQLAFSSSQKVNQLISVFQIFPNWNLQFNLFKMKKVKQSFIVQSQENQQNVKMVIFPQFSVKQTKFDKVELQKRI